MNRTIMVTLVAADEGAEHFNCEAVITGENLREVVHYHLSTSEIIGNSGAPSGDPVIDFLKERAAVSRAVDFSELKAAAETGSFEIQAGAA